MEGHSVYGLVHERCRTSPENRWMRMQLSVGAATGAEPARERPDAPRHVTRGEVLVTTFSYCTYHWVLIAV
jgi:hypothetical protein